MTNLAGLSDLLKIRKNYAYFALLGVIFFIFAYSAGTLTTKPKFWIDEAAAVELAHNFSESGTLDILTSPGQFSGAPQLVQSTGYPLTIVLALIFKVFGFGLVFERITMLLFMAGFLAAAYFLGEKLFGKKESLFAMFLIASFASFYASGRTAVGEIPGLIFLLACLYFWLFKDYYCWSGLFLGLAVVTKPSVFLLALPAILLSFLLDRKDFFKKTLKLGTGILPAIAGWIFLILPDPFSKEVWLGIFDFYKNPYASSVMENITGNLSGFFGSTTLIYFGVLFLLVILARFWMEDGRQKSFYNFTIIYGLIAFAYYLRSPGWLRYILIAEILTLFAVPSAFSVAFAKLRGFFPGIKLSVSRLSGLAVVALVIIQLFNFFTSAEIYFSDSAIKAAEFINETFPGKSVWITDSFEASVLLKTTDKYQTIKFTGIPTIGNNLVLEKYLPEVIVTVGEEKFTPAEKQVLLDNYKGFAGASDYKIHVLK